MIASDATRPPAKPPPGALWPAKNRYSDSAIIDGNRKRVATTTISGRRPASTLEPDVVSQRGLRSRRVRRVVTRGRLCTVCVRNTSDAMPTATMTRTEISPKVSHARMSTSRTLTALAPWPSSSAICGIASEIGSDDRAAMAKAPTTAAVAPTATASQARARSRPVGWFVVFAGRVRSTRTNTTMVMVSTRSCVSARSGAPYSAKTSARP